MMDLTDRNNVKYEKLTTVLGVPSLICFYYNKTNKDYKYWGITQGGRYPGKEVEQYVIDYREPELREYAEHKIKAMGGKGGNGKAGFGDVSPDKVYPKGYRRG